CPPRLRPVGFFLTGGGAAGGLAEGGSEELEEVCPRRCSSSLTRLCNCSSCTRNSSISASRCWHPEQAGSLMASIYYPAHPVATGQGLKPPERLPPEHGFRCGSYSGYSTVFSRIGISDWEAAMLK